MTKQEHEFKKEQCHCEDCDCEEETTCDCEECGCEECNCEEDTKAQEYLESLQRLQAEFDNYRKRNEFIVVKAREEGVIKVIEKILPVLDSFRSAEMQLTEEEFKGLSLVKEQLITALKQLGVSQIEALNKPFDPNLHNAIMVGEDEEKESGMILEVFQEGYRLGDKVIRHSIVKVNQ